MTLEIKIVGKNNMTREDNISGGIGLLFAAACVGGITYFQPLQYEKAHLNLPTSIQSYDLNRDGIIDNKESQSLTNLTFK